MTRRWTITRPGCKCPAAWECPDCKETFPYVGYPGRPGPCACDRARDEMQRMQKEYGERYWAEHRPAIETWNLEEPE
jgi:hypothetical protein